MYKPGVVCRFFSVTAATVFLASLSTPSFAQTITDTNPTVAATVYGQPIDSLGSLTDARKHYTWDGTHTVPWFAETIEVDEEGSGTAASPTRAAYGLGINVTKRNWTSSSIAGELDGGSLFGRNGVGDIAGMLVNVGTRQGFSGILEGVSYSFDASGAVVRGVRSLVGVNAPSATGADGSERGFATLADQGDLDAAFFAGRNGGTWKDFLRNEVTADSAVTRFSGDGTQYDFGSNLASQDIRLSAGVGRSGNGSSYLDLIGSVDDATNSYGLRILRNSAGSSIIHRGFSPLVINAQIGSVALQANSVNLLIASGATITLPQGMLSIAEAPTTSVPLPAAGAQVLFIDSADHKLKRKNSAGVITIIG